VQAAGDELAELFASSCWHQHARFLSRWRAPQGVRGTATGLGAPIWWIELPPPVVARGGK